MSDSKGGSNEPSMEEILASIRRIIDEDSEQAEKGETAAVKPQPGASSDAPSKEHWPEDREAPPAESEEEVLELTQLVNEDGSISDLSEDRTITIEPVVVEEEDRQEEPREEESGAAQRYDEPQSVVQAHHEPAPAKTTGEEEEGEDKLRATTESQVQAEVQAWLDRNLPEMVERIVREEVERMLRRLKDD